MSFQNFFAAKLANDIGASDTTILLDTAVSVTSGRLVFEARNPTQREIVKFTGTSGNSITGVTRGVGGTTAKTHLKSALVEMNATSEDLQDLYDAFAAFTASNTNWFNAITSVTSVVYNGQRNYTLTLNSDQTGVISPGMRGRTTRTVAAPTQSTSLNGTTQYWNKTSPNKLTFTNNFVCSAWVKLASYAGYKVILSRFNGTNGFEWGISPSGIVYLTGYNAGNANQSAVNSYQSIPLNKWVHITAQLDMATFTATPTTSYIMLDGVDIPASVSRSGTNPTALIQAGNLEIGSSNGGTNPFNGKIAQVAVFNAKVTQANIRTYISQGLSGSETSLASAYSFNGVATDLNVATPNNLTAQNSAGYTADSPFGTQGNGSISSTLDYGIIASIDATTIVVNVPEGCTIPTSGGVTTLSYSSMAVPYGFPKDANRWDILTYINTTQTTAVGALNTDTASNTKILAPIGKWNAGMNMPVGSGQGTSTGAGNNDCALMVKGASMGLVPGMYLRNCFNNGASAAAVWITGSQYQDIVISSAEIFTIYGNMSSFTGGNASFSINGGTAFGPTILSLKNNYL